MSIEREEQRLAESLEAFITHMGYSEQEIADQLGTSRQTVHGWIHSKRVPLKRYAAIGRLIEILPSHGSEFNSSLFDIPLQ